MTYELRRYHIKPGHMDEFLPVWKTIVEPRKVYGFEVPFAVADPENNLFIWLVKHDGDFDAAEKEYYDSPERATALENAPSNVTDHLDGAEVSKVTRVL